MKIVTNAMCVAAEGDYFHEYIDRQVATAKEDGQNSAIVPIWTGYRPETYVLLMQSRGFHVEFWEATEFSPERMYIAW